MLKNLLEEETALQALLDGITSQTFQPGNAYQPEHTPYLYSNFLLANCNMLVTENLIPGDDVVTAGDEESKEVYFIESGTAELKRGSVQLEFPKAGAFFGEKVRRSCD